MRKFFIDNFIVKMMFIFWFSLSLSVNILAQESNNVTIQLKGNKYISIQACTDQIFRIRVNTKNEFPHSLMEHYGLLKTDWINVKTSNKKEKNTTIFQTGKNHLIVNNETGDISVKDSNGKVIIGSIRSYMNGSHPKFQELQESLLKFSSNIKRGGGVIGDSNYTGIKDSSGAAKIISASVVEVGLSPDERFYGGGTTSRKNINHRGEILRIWTTYQKTEIPMPFLMSSNGWAIFYNTTSLNYFDVGRFQSDKLMVLNTGGEIDFYLMLGNSYEESINQYVTITGKPYLLPKWAYGFAFNGHNLENQFNVLDNAVRFRDEKIPCDVYCLEPPWMKKYYDYSTSKDWDLDRFPAEPFWEQQQPDKYEHPLLFISKLHRLGYKLVLWLCIDHDLSIEAEDQIAKKLEKPESGLEHWFPHLTRFIDQGVDGFKLDPGNTIMEHPQRKYFNGYTDKEMHNLNQVLLTKQMYETFRDHKGIRSLNHYCGGYSGTQHWVASTSGDNGGGKDALFDQLNLGFSGFVNTSVDVMEVSRDFKGAMHFGFFLPWVQVNSWYALHYPWYYPQAEEETFRYYAQLRNMLIPYVYSAAIEGSQTGMPMLRPMPIEFPDDRDADNLIYQYMFGENLLVGVFSDTIYLPEGEWIDYWSGEKITGGKTIKCNIPKYRGGPIFIRQGAIMPYQKLMQYVEEFPLDTLIVKVFPHKNSTYTLWEDDGRTFEYESGRIMKTTFECSETDKKIEFVIQPAQGDYKGAYQSRTYSLEIHVPGKPSGVMINGASTNEWEYADPGTLSLSLFQNDVHRKQVVTITM